MNRDPGTARPVEVVTGVCNRPLSGEALSGDGALVVRHERRVLLTLADGLGHGERAAAATTAFLRVVEQNAWLGMRDLFFLAHRALVGTRGVVATVARYDGAGSLEIAGLGNVSAHLLQRNSSKPPQCPLLTPGVVGSAFRPVRLHDYKVDGSWILVLCSDGVHGHWEPRIARGMAPQEAAEEIIRAHGKATDDAACLVAAFPWESPRTPKDMPPPPSRRSPGIRERFAVRSEVDLTTASAMVRALAERVGFGTRSQWEIALAMSELGTTALGAGMEVRFQVDVEVAPRLQLSLECWAQNSRGGDGSWGAPRFADIEGGATSGPGGEGVGEARLSKAIALLERTLTRVHHESLSQGGFRVTAIKFGDS